MTPCPFCGAPTLRLAVGGTIRAVDFHPVPNGALEVNRDAGMAYPTKATGPSYSGTRHQLHKDGCPDWRGPVRG